MSGENDWAFRVANQFRRMLQAVFLNLEHGMRTIGARLGRFEVEDGFALLRILGDINEHRTGAAGTRDLKG